MKTLIVVLGFLACASSLPAHKPASSEIPSGFFFPFVSIRGFGLDSSQEDSTSSADSDESTGMFLGFPPFRFPFDFGSIFRLPDLLGDSADPDTKVYNSTSETKVINGGQAVVNETYSINNKTGATIYKVSITYNMGTNPEVSESSTQVNEVSTTKESEKKEEDNDIKREPILPGSDNDQLEA